MDIIKEWVGSACVNMQNSVTWAVIWSSGRIVLAPLDVQTTDTKEMDLLSVFHPLLNPIRPGGMGSVSSRSE
jgi:hypothetical protein